MPIVTIQQSPRSVEMKRELAHKITEAFCKLMRYRLKRCKFSLLKPVMRTGQKGAS